MSEGQSKVKPRTDGTWLRRVKDKIILWILAKLFGLFIAVMVSFPKRSRMSHNNGIAGVGWLKIVDNPEWPEHEFFQPGRKFPIRVRHASATFLDDAMKCIRSISIKFADKRFKSPFDLEMNTGQFSLFWSASSFYKFGKKRAEQYGIEYVDYNRVYPDGHKGAVESLRIDPSSFQNLHYYAKTPFKFISMDGTLRYVKYRVLPADDAPETGIDENPSEWDTCNQRIDPYDTKGRNYLKYEWEDCVREGRAKYKLQIQLHDAEDYEDPEIFNNMVVWDEKEHPWMDLAYFEIERTLDWKESTMTTFSVKNMPKTLGVLPAQSIYDYNSLNYFRTHSEIARHARRLSYKFFGFPPEIPNNDLRNSSDWAKGKYSRYS